MTRYLIGIGLCLLLSCHGGETDPQLKRAFEMHEIALHMHDSLKNELDALPVQSLTAEDQQKLEQIKEARMQWEENVVEVPGFEHAHDHDHNHDHNHDHAHDALKDLPPAEILKIQEALMKEVKRLLNETRGLAATNTQSSQ